MTTKITLTPEGGNFSAIYVLEPRDYLGSYQHVQAGLNYFTWLLFVIL